MLYFYLRRVSKLKKAEADRIAANAFDPVVKQELDGHEILPKIYDTGPEVDLNDDAKKFVPGAVEIGTGREDPIFEMPAEEVALEIDSIREASELGERDGLRRGLAGSPVSPNSRLGIPRSKRKNSGNVSPRSLESSMTSPTSVLRADKLGASPAGTLSPVSTMSPSSIDFVNRSPLDEMWI